MGLSVAATLLAVALVAGLLAWVRRDLRARGAPMRVWWLVVGCYLFAALAWLIAITAPLPVAVAWLATIPAAVATVVPERVGLVIGVGRRPARRTRPIAAARHLPHAPMARPVSATGVRARRRPEPARGHEQAKMSEPARGHEQAKMSEPARGHEQAKMSEPARRPSVASQRSLHLPGAGRHGWHPGDLRLAIELLEDAALIPDLDQAARDRIDVRLERLERFRTPATTELLALVRNDVHARLASDVPPIDPDPDRARRIALLLDELDPGPAGTAEGSDGGGAS